MKLFDFCKKMNGNKYEMKRSDEMIDACQREKSKICDILKALETIKEREVL